MNPTEAAALQWGRGDLYTLAVAVVVSAILCIVHRNAIKAKGAECGDILAGIFSNSLTLGPLGMILADPVNKWLGLFPVDLLAVAVSEARVTLVLACFIAFLNTLLGLFRARQP